MDQDSGTPFGRLFFIFMWLSVFGVLWLLFDKALNVNSEAHEPEVQWLNGQAQVTLQRGRDGHYRALGYINRVQVPFLLDTGASDIVIPQSLAESLGLPLGHRLQVQTANGPTHVYTTKLTQVQLGTITQTRLPALVNPADQGEDILLGMRFLKHVDFYQKGDQLTLMPRTATP